MYRNSIVFVPWISTVAQDHLVLMKDRGLLFYYCHTFCVSLKTIVLLTHTCCNTIYTKLDV